MPLSLIGRVNSVKMNILPKYLYLFQCIPLYLPKKFFVTLDKLILKFIWNGKSAHIRKDFMQRPRSLGGLAIPSFQLYYWAANIRNMLYWFSDSNSETPSWVHIEASNCGKTSLPALLSSALPLELHTYKHNPLLYDSLRIWVQFRKKFGLFGIARKAPLCSNHMFPPSMNDSAFETWSSKGLQIIKDLFIDGIFASFSQLTDQFNIPGTHFYRYLQIRHFIASRYTTFPNLPEITPLDNILDIDARKKGVIKEIYCLLIEIHTPSLSIIKAHWEKDLGINLSDDLWDSMLKRVHSSSICARHGLLQFKVLHRLHISKEKLAKIYPESDPMCNRCKADIGSLLHTFWTCPNLNKYWTSIFNTFSEVYRVNFTPSVLTALFGVVPSNISLTKHYSNAIAFASLLARRLILLRWKQEHPPTHDQWIADIMRFLNMEKMRCTLTGSLSKFNKAWQPFLKYMETFKMCTVPCHGKSATS